jgi:phytoene synthase
MGIAQEQLLEIMDGVEMDLNQTRYTDYRALRLYCHRVAGVVGEVSAQIFGYTERATLKYATLLGLAFQLTNIIRDVGEDARRGRIYLPLDELQAHGVSEADVLAGRETEAFRRLMEYQYERAIATYEQALARLPAADRRSQRPGLVMAAIYRTLLEEIRRDGFQVLRHRIALPPMRKLWLAWRTWVLG